MKLNRLLIISLAALIGLGISSCERVYDAPLLTEPTVTIGEEGIITIAEYKEKYKDASQKGKLVEEDFALRAVVAANDVSGNIYKQIYIQDATGGISVSIGQNNLANDYQVGQEVFVKLQGLAAVKYGGVIQIGMVNTDKNLIPYEVAKQHILKNKWPNPENIKPKVVTIGDLNDAMLGTLVQLENVYFELGGTAPFGDQSFNTVNRILKDTAGKSLIVRNSKFSTFANDIMPKGNGTVVGIFSKFNKDYQLTIRSSQDCFNFTGKDPVTGGNEGGVTPPATGSVIFTETFTTSLGAFTASSVSGEQVWKQNSFKGKTYATMSGFNKTNNANVANEDWLISPVFDFSSAKSASVSFQHTINKGDVSKMQTEQTLWVSTDYSGNVATAKWTQVTIPTYPAGNNWTYVPSGDITFPSSVLGKANVVFAFKYICTTASSGQWQIQDVKVTSDGGKLVARGTNPTPAPTPNPEPAGSLLFPGSNFDDWAAFTSSLSRYGLTSSVQSTTGGRNGSSALHINEAKVGTLPANKPQTNPYVFSAQIKDWGKKKINKIHFYIKGTSGAGRSASINVYHSGGTAYYNLGTIDGSNTTVTLPSGTKNDYSGNINTQDKWIKVTLDVSNLSLASNRYGDSFAFKIGGTSTGVAWNLYVDDLTFE